MPYANNNGVKIYYELEGQGPPLVLAHGSSADLTFWRKLGYVDALKGDFQLVLFDARGHGKSDKPHKVSDYGLNWADDVVAILDDACISKAHFLGYSQGGWIGFRLAVRRTGRFLSFFLADMSPYSQPEAMVKTNKDAREMVKLLLIDPEAYFRSVESFFRRPITPAERDRWLAMDAKAGIAVLTSLLDDPPLTDQDLEKISAPCLVYCGELDPFHPGAKESVIHIPKARFVSIPGIDHGAAWSRSDLMLPHIKEFLAQASKT
jgi:pimeloyl-ACP methyl ester carboxylesterase